MKKLISELSGGELGKIADKVVGNVRLTRDEGLFLYENARLGELGILSDYRRRKLHQNKAFYNINIHIEPTNVCIYNCKFCSYRRKKGEKNSWEYSKDEIVDIVKKKAPGKTEIHIVGGVHPDWDLFYYADIIKSIRVEFKSVHIKGFTAVELDHMIRKAGLSLEKGLQYLKEAGLNSLPGGGAEIFNDEIRKKVCHEKSTSSLWLKIHETAHRLNIPSNATMLYGHIESYEDRIDHLAKLREVQDRTNGFNAFIPLKYKSGNNILGEIGEVNYIEDLKNFAISRLFLDNFDHIKSYWPMIGKEMAQLSLSFGVDDIDGTIEDTTKIYTMAGATEQKPSMTVNDIKELIQGAGFKPVERDSLYNEIR